MFWRKTKKEGKVEKDDNFFISKKAWAILGQYGFLKIQCCDEPTRESLEGIFSRLGRSIEDTEDELSDTRKELYRKKGHCSEMEKSLEQKHKVILELKKENYELKKPGYNFCKNCSFCKLYDHWGKNNPRCCSKDAVVDSEVEKGLIYGQADVYKVRPKMGKECPYFEYGRG